MGDEMKPHKHGTCGGDFPCRWSTEDSDSLMGRIDCHHANDTDDPGPNDPDWWCSNWEPPEGRCCGNCDIMVDASDEEDKHLFCPLRARPVHPLDGCDRWRWDGGER